MHTGEERYAAGHSRPTANETAELSSGISDMTLRRWKGDPEKNTPPPMVINDIEYNDVEAWDAWWKAQTVTRIQRAERSNRKNPNSKIIKKKRSRVTA